MISSRSVLTSTLAVVILANSLSQVIAYRISIKTTPILESWEGWGTSLSWWANVFGDREDIADVLFSNMSSVSIEGAAKDIPALNFNIARYNIGGSGNNVIDDSGTEIAMKTSEKMSAFKAIESFWLDWTSTDPASKSWNWDADANQRAMLDLASKRGANVFEAYSNSPPWWMTNNRATAGGDDGAADNLNPAYLEQFAVYLATVVSKAKSNWGVEFKYVAPFHEANSKAWAFPESQEACHLGVKTQSDILKVLRTQLDKLNLQNVLIAGAEEKNPEEALHVVVQMTQSEYPGIDAIAKVNAHCSDGVAPYAGDDRDKLKGMVSSLTKRPSLWDSMYADEDASGLTMADAIARDINEMGASAFVYKQALDSGVLGLIQSNPGDNWIGSANPKHYVMAHYSRHIHAGMSILKFDDPNTLLPGSSSYALDKYPNFVVAYDENTQVMVIVATNFGDAQTVTFDLSALEYVDGPINTWTTEPNSTTGAVYKTSSIDILFGQSARFSADLLAQSITTLEILGAELTNTVTV
ncbi:Endo-beta-1 [Phytophthora nicotianae]|uniref:Endo-beta-1 n=1 Tax=Phytophthora nicotianae TaxID=4792 RepID=A0A0W8D5A6_PHYNI|nr:Endo-beta-1 [Phytophthora nicotianae]